MQDPPDYVTGPAKTILLFTVIISVGAGLKYFHIYYNFYHIPFANISLPLFEIIYKSTILVIDPLDYTFRFLYYLACVSLTLFANYLIHLIQNVRHPWYRFRAVWIILLSSVVITAWMFFGHHMIDYTKGKATDQFIDDIIQRDDLLARAQITLKQDKDEEVPNCKLKDDLKNGCYLLIHQDANSLYLLHDPAIDPSWKLDLALSESKRKSIRNIAMEECIAKLGRGNIIQIDTCQKEKQRKLFSDEKDKLIESHRDKYKEYNDKIQLSNLIQEQIKTIQIPLASVKHFDTLPIPSKLKSECKSDQTACR
ncbi:MAG: hypothetical protein HQM04_18655 [Magnetococcales bacterium]|nr:hypothetical protein [Magnetococcales bacterium]